MTSPAPPTFRAILDDVLQRLNAGERRRDACAGAGVSELNFLRWVERYERTLTRTESEDLAVFETADRLAKLAATDIRSCGENWTP